MTLITPILMKSMAGACDNKPSKQGKWFALDSTGLAVLQDKVWYEKEDAYAAIEEAKEKAAAGDMSYRALAGCNVFGPIDICYDVEGNWYDCDTGEPHANRLSAIHFNTNDGKDVGLTAVLSDGTTMTLAKAHVRCLITGWSSVPAVWPGEPSVVVE